MTPGHILFLIMDIRAHLTWFTITGMNMSSKPSTLPTQSMVVRDVAKHAKRASKQWGVEAAAPASAAGGAGARADAPKDVSSLPATPRTVVSAAPVHTDIDEEYYIDKGTFIDVGIFIDEEIFNRGGMQRKQMHIVTLASGRRHRKQMHHTTMARGGTHRKQMHIMTLASGRRHRKQMRHMTRATTSSG